MLLATQIDPDGQTFIVPAHSHQISQLGDIEATEPVAWVRAFDGNGIRRQSRDEASAQFGMALLRWAGS